MTIAEAVKDATAPRYCKFGRVLVDLASADFEAITSGLEGDLTPTAAARILTANGHPLNEKAIRVHNSGECCCRSAS